MFNSPRTSRRSLQHHLQNMLTRLTLVSLLLPVIVMLFVPQANAQVLYGSLTGNVTDQKGASVPGAKVEAVNTSTGESRNVTTDERGGFTFSSIQVGSYKLTVTLASFKTLIKEDIKVEPNKVYRFDPQLEVGEVSESVIVTADTGPPLQTDRADVNITQTTRQVNDLPLTGSLGRNYQSLMALVPGSVMAGEQNSTAGNP